MADNNATTTSIGIHVFSVLGSEKKSDTIISVGSMREFKIKTYILFQILDR